MSTFCTWRFSISSADLVETKLNFLPFSREKGSDASTKSQPNPTPVIQRGVHKIAQVLCLPGRKMIYNNLQSCLR